MDLDSLFWTGLVFYFIYKAFSGGSRNRRSAPTGENSPAKGQTGSGHGDDLNAALGEIRRALGMPANAPEPEVVEQAGDGSAATRRTRPSEHRDAVFESRPSDRAEQLERAKRLERSERAKRLERSERAKRLERSERAERLEQPTRLQRHTHATPSSHGPTAPSGFGGRPATGADRGAPDLKSSFAEEDAFEREGRHAHKRTRGDQPGLSPYDAPEKKQLSAVVHELASRRSMREAVLLKEILDRPVSMRRR